MTKTKTKNCGRLLIAILAATGAMSVALASSCIISGLTERPCTSSAFAVASEIEARSSAEGWGVSEDMPEFESRIWSWGFADPLPMFNSDMPGFMLFLR